MSNPRKLVPHPTDHSLALVPLTQGKWAVIDAAYSAQVGRFNWFANKGNKTCYAGTNHPLEDGSGRQFMGLHRFIAKLGGMPTADLIDHKNMNGLDCRLSNLRPSTKSTNARNRGIDKNNTSGVKGVHFEAQTGKWRAELWVDNKHLRLGRFESKDDAASAVAEARTKYHGEFARADA